MWRSARPFPKANRWPNSSLTILRGERNRRAADVASAQADIATAEASLKLLQQELNRLDRLRTSPAFSEARYDDKAQETVRAKSQRAEAQAQLKSAEAELQLAEIALRDTVVLAPYDGTITQRHSEAGAYVQVGAPLVTMLDHNNLEIEADVPANRVPGLEPGLVLDATITDGSPLRAIVRAVIPDENPRTRTRRARFVAEFPGKKQIHRRQPIGHGADPGRRNPRCPDGP